MFTLRRIIGITTYNNVKVEKFLYITSTKNKNNIKRIQNLPLFVSRARQVPVSTI